MKILSTIILKKTIAALVSAVMAIAPLSAQMATSISNTQKAATSYSTTVNSNNLSNLKLNLFGKTVKDYTGKSLYNSKDNPRMFNKKSVPTLEVKGYEAPAYTAPDFSVEYSDPEAVAEEETQANEPIATWDVSETEDDNVTMSYYNTDDVSFLDEVTAAIANIFLPMTAYAAEDEAPEAETRYEGGTVIIDGEGITDQFLFLRWLNYDAFASAYEAWCISNGDQASAYILCDSLDANGNFSTNPVSISQAHDGYDSNEAMLNDYLPYYISEFVYLYEPFWEECVTFVPTHVIIQGDVTEINFGAFAFCTTIETVEITGNVEAIGVAAFNNTGIREIHIPDTVKCICDAAFAGSKNLENVYFEGDIWYLDRDTFVNIDNSLTLNCKTRATYNYIAKVDPNTPSAAALDDEFEAPSTNISDNIVVTFNPSVFN